MFRLARYEPQAVTNYTSEPTRQEAARAALERGERAGFRLMLVGRSIVLVIAFAGFGYGFFLSGNPWGPLVTGGSLLLGILILAAHGTPYEATWQRYFVMGVDIATLSFAALVLPLTTGGDVPRIFVFRAYDLTFVWILLAISSLALSPRLILFTGICLVAGLWLVFAFALSEIDAPRSWGDIRPGATPQEYMNLLLDPSFVGYGNRVQESTALLIATLVLAFVVGRARGILIAFSVEADRRQRTESLFGQYVPSDVVRKLIEEPGSLKPVVVTGTALFMDVENFTSYAERNTPEHVLQTLSDFLARATEMVVRNGGVVIWFGGDSLLATFGVPLASRDHADQAIRTGREMLADVRRRMAEQDAFGVRIGIATGSIAAGSIGSSSRQSYTVYGSAVNLAQRLQSHARELGTRILISKSAADAASAGSELSALGQVRLKGLGEPIAIFTDPLAGNEPREEREASP